MKTKQTLCTILLIGTTAVSLAATRDWTGNTDSDWLTMGNWSAAYITADAVRVGYSGLLTSGRWPVISGDVVTAGRIPTNVTVGQGTNATVTMVSGVFTNSGRILLGNAVNTNGTWIQEGGDLSCALDIQVGNIAGSSGTFNLKGGAVRSVGNFNVPLAANAAGNAVVSGGSLKSQDINLGNGSASTGNFSMTSGDVTLTRNLNIANGANSTAAFSMTGGTLSAPSGTFAVGSGIAATGTAVLVNCILTNGVANIGKGAGAVAKVSVTNATLYCITRFDLNNGSYAGLTNEVILGDGGIIDTEAAALYKGTITICTNGQFIVRNVGAQDTPLDIADFIVIDLVGGEIWIRADHTATGAQQVVADWIADGKIKTSLPGKSVLYKYDSVSGYTKIYAGEMPPVSGTLLSISVANNNFNIGWVDTNALSTLKTRTNLMVGNWDLVNMPATVINQTNYSLIMTNDVATNGATRFFLLSYP